MDAQLAEVLADHPVVTARRHPRLRQRIQRAAGRGELTRVLPAVYARTDTATTLETRVAAALAWHDSAVIVGEAAAALTFWPELPVGSVEVALPRAWNQPWPGFTPVVEQVPRAWVRGDRIAHSTWTALDLIPRLGPAAYFALRRDRWVEPAEVDAALRAHAGRRGTAQRRAVVRARAWSQAEADFHELLREAGIRGWRANVELYAGPHRYFADVLFRRRRAIAEIEGFTHHSGPKEFRDMLARSRNLTLAGWTVLHFTWADIVKRPKQLLEQIRLAIG
ncbi:endonuclease domain-containing protein [Parenemella sanctibonifatiensis]|uniref:DUF559 domain-containing protein n=1 Tax=Parenemella sanctibonifatiensis TaxID=2016505 RepID=A0A255EAY1_9ACTN|nr:DUF559 domain-containing protein [Parenemella sanctibonifatiensis]OYN85303.1 hypothetical protein CGZ92_10905 [Parenemella sanctibonifatiensis]